MTAGHVSERTYDSRDPGLTSYELTIVPAILHSDSTRVVTKLTALKSHTVHGKLTVIKTELEIRLNNGSMGHKYTRPMAHEPADPSRLVLVR